MGHTVGGSPSNLDRSYGERVCEQTLNNTFCREYHCDRRLVAIQKSRGDSEKNKQKN